MSELPHYHQMKATVTVPALCRRPQSHHPSLGTPRNPNDDKHITVESRCSHGNSLRSFLLHQAPLRISSPLASYRLFSPDSRPIRRVLCSQKNGKRTAKYAVLGAGFAGLSVAWHLLQYSSKDSCMKIDLYDEVGIGGGASGSSGGLLHPYSPKAKLLWRGAESWKECMKLLTEAERVTGLSASRGTDENQTYSFDGPLILRRGILRPATAEAKMEILKANARNGISSCTIEILDGQAAKGLVPSLSVPLDLAVYFPQAMNIHPKRYLQALFVACENFANDISSTYASTEIKLRKKSVHSLHELDGEYDAVVVCLGAKVGTLPELSGRLPLRTCRGVIAELELLSNKGEPDDGCPSILSDAWLAFQGPLNVLMGSTWEWGSDNCSSSVMPEEASRAMEELLPKASVVYPNIKKWGRVGARAGLRAMPPLTPLGSLPLLGCVTEMVAGGKDGSCRYWLVGGLGSRGLLYHGLLGKMVAQAVIYSDEVVLPSELTSWKKMAVWRKAS